MDKWLRWKDKMPPMNKKLLWYSEITGKIGMGEFNVSKYLSNREDVFNFLKGGEWISYGAGTSYATHWLNIPDLPPLKKKQAFNICDSCKQIIN